MKRFPALAKNITYIVFFVLLIPLVFVANLDNVVSGLIWLPVIVLACFFIFAFTRSLGAPTEGQQPPNVMAKETANQESFTRLLLMLRAGYFFMLLTLGICIVPFVAPNVMFEHLTSGEQHNGPFQIVVGCAEGPESKVPISCDNTSFSPQWLVSLGASRSNTPVWPGRSKTITTLEEQLTEVRETTKKIVAQTTQTVSEGAMNGRVDDLQKAFESFETSVQAFEAEADKANAINKAYLDTITGFSRFSETAKDSLTKLNQETDQAKHADIAQALEEQATDIAATLERFSAQAQEDNKIAYLKGGLVVPLYVIVLSLLGGSISMTRKLPEIQLRAAPRYQDFFVKQVKAGMGDTLQTPIQAVQARDFLLFQILQVVTAPFLAMVAYSSIQPETVASAVAVGFGAGFASEPLLLRMRQAVDGLAGLNTKEQAENVRKNIEAEPEGPGQPDADDAAGIAVDVVRQNTPNPTNT